MVKQYLRHTVADFKNWKVVYDKHDATRREFGCQKSEVFVNAQNPNEVLIVMEWKSQADATKFAQSSNLKEAMQNAGVVSHPEVSFAD